MHRDDTTLDSAMDRYADGDAAAFAIVYDALAPELGRFLGRFAGAGAEDLVQQTFFQMHLARGTFVRGAPVRPWAFAIARRLLIDRIRRQRREAAARADLPRPTSSVALPDEDCVARETAATLAALLADLPEAQRAVLELVRGEGLSMREAATALGTTVDAVKLRASRALRRVKLLIFRAERQRT